MTQKSKLNLSRMAAMLSLAVVLTLFYMVWTHSTDPGNLLIIFITAFIIAASFSGSNRFPRLSVKKIGYSILYIFYLFISIVRSNLDVARRVVQRKIPINPGIVSVKTKLKSPVGKMILANSITLTPGTLSVDIKGDQFFVHWIDVTDIDEEGATKTIVSGFEKYLEVIFG